MIINMDLAIELYNELIALGLKSHNVTENQFCDVIKTINFINTRREGQSEIIDNYKVESYAIPKSWEIMILPCSIRDDISDRSSTEYKDMKYYSTENPVFKEFDENKVLGSQLFNKLTLRIAVGMDHKTSDPRVNLSMPTVQSYETMKDRLCNTGYIVDQHAPHMVTDLDGELEVRRLSIDDPAMPEKSSGTIPIATLNDRRYGSRRVTTATVAVQQFFNDVSLRMKNTKTSS